MQLSLSLSLPISIAVSGSAPSTLDWLVFNGIPIQFNGEQLIFN
jgi:hypothetical protein